MTDLIKEKLLKEIEKYKNERIKGISERLQADHLWFLRGKLQQHEETSKAKDEEFIKILDELLPKFYEDGAEVYAEEIKQRIKEE